MFPRKRMFTTILNIRRKLFSYNVKAGRLGLEPRTKALKARRRVIYEFGRIQTKMAGKNSLVALMRDLRLGDLP